jgi:hypothetical protein
VVDAAGKWTSSFKRGPQRSQGKPGIDGVPDRITDNATRPGVEDHRYEGEAAQDGDVGQVGYLELVRPVRRDIFHQVGKIEP